MKMVPLFRCDDLAAALKFYTEVLDFQVEPGGSASDSWSAFCVMMSS